MDYKILDDLLQVSEERTADFCEKNNIFFTSEIEEVTEPFAGSADTIRLFIFKNYVSNSGLMNLAIIIRDVRTSLKSEGGLAVNNVECAIYPLYLAHQDAFDLPEPEPEPDIHPDNIKFIIAKRKLPKRPQGVEPDQTKYKWTVNQIASELHIDNRAVAQYCRVKNI